MGDISEADVKFALYCIMDVSEALGKSNEEVYSLLKQCNALEDYVIKLRRVLSAENPKYMVTDVVEEMQYRGVLRC